MNEKIIYCDVVEDWKGYDCRYRWRVFVNGEHFYSSTQVFRSSVAARRDVVIGLENGLVYRNYCLGVCS